MARRVLAVMMLALAACSQGAAEPVETEASSTTTTTAPTTATTAPTATTTTAPATTTTTAPTTTTTMPAAAAFPCVDGESSGFACLNVGLEAQIEMADLGGLEQDFISDLWGWTDPETGAEIAIVMSAFSAVFVDVTVPSDPVILGRLPLPEEVTDVFGLRDVKVIDDHAFMVSESLGHGLQVFDLTTLRDIEPGAELEQLARFDGFLTAHNVGANPDTGYVYAVGVNTCLGGIHMVDVSDPANPVDAGCFEEHGYVHDLQCVIYNGPADEFLGRELCVGANEDTVGVTDVTDKDAVESLANITYPDASYTHQGWLTEDHRYYLLGDEIDEAALGVPTRTYVFDLLDPTDPQLVGFYESPTNAIDHNLFIVDDLVFTANYTSGLRIARIDDLATASLTEVGFFDQIPGPDAADFGGAFSVYPFFESGTIVMTSMGEGLFVLTPDIPEG